MKDNLGMKTQRKQYGAQLKSNVALAALRGKQAANEIGNLHGIHIGA